MNIKTVWKYPVALGTNTYILPQGSQFLCIQEQRGKAESWWLVNPESPKTERHQFLVVMTGSPFEAGGAVYRGTLQIQELVFHVFEYPVE